MSERCIDRLVTDVINVLKDKCVSLDTKKELYHGTMACVIEIFDTYPNAEKNMERLYNAHREYIMLK